jgi:hypothetical protein
MLPPPPSLPKCELLAMSEQRAPRRGSRHGRAPPSPAAAHKAFGRDDGEAYSPGSPAFGPPLTPVGRTTADIGRRTGIVCTPNIGTLTWTVSRRRRDLDAGNAWCHEIPAHQALRPCRKGGVPHSERGAACDRLGRSSRRTPGNQAARVLFLQESIGRCPVSRRILGCVRVSGWTLQAAAAAADKSSFRKRYMFSLASGDRGMLHRTLSTQPPRRCWAR